MLQHSERRRAAEGLGETEAPPGGQPEHVPHVSTDRAGHVRISTRISGTISKTLQHSGRGRAAEGLREAAAPPPLPGGLASHVDAEIAEYVRISVGISGTMSKSQRGQGSEVRGRRSPTS